MNGLQVKQILQFHDVKKKDVAEKMGMSLENFVAIFKVQDVKSGILERISNASGIPLSEFYGIGHTATANGDGSTAVAGVGNTITSNTEVTVLREKVKHLEEMLQEKERMIQILLEKR